MIVDKENINDSLESSIDLKKEIEKLKKEKGAVILVHYYQSGEIQDIADYIGDSLALAQIAARIAAPMIIMCGVNFMGETAKILCPDKKVIVPDLNAGCSLADSCPPEELEKFINAHPGHKVISYVNTSAGVKALTDVVVTSSNAVQIVESFPKDEKIIFGPDRNLGNYINSVTGRNMLLWNGACHVHENFSEEKLKELKKKYPEAKVLAHPECKKSLLLLADKIGSTAALLKYAIESEAKEYIIATESGIVHEMRKKCPEKLFITVPGKIGTSVCNVCNFMKLNTLEKVYKSLKNEIPEIKVEKNLADKARLSIQRMLDISEKLGL